MLQIQVERVKMDLGRFCQISVYCLYMIDSFPTKSTSPCFKKQAIEDPRDAEISYMLGGALPLQSPILRSVCQRSGGEKLIRCLLYALDCLQKMPYVLLMVPFSLPLFVKHPYSSSRSTGSSGPKGTYPPKWGNSALTASQTLLETNFSHVSLQAHGPSECPGLLSPRGKVVNWLEARPLVCTCVASAAVAVGAELSKVGGAL